MNIVALVGASCTGKTTIFDELKKEYANDTTTLFVEEAARIFFANNRHLGLNERFSKESQRQIQLLARQLLMEAADQSPQLVICDRTVMDPIVFTRVNTSDQGEDMYSDVQDLVQKYNMIFLLSPEGIPFVNDNERHEGEEMRQHLHEGFIAFFAEHHIPYTLVTGDREARIKLVKAEIDKLGDGL